MPVPSNRRAQAAAHIQGGLKALAAGAIPAARASLQAAVALEPSWAEPRFQLARIHHAAGDRELAEQTLRAAREADPQHAPSTHMLGTMLCDREAFVEALPLLREAATLEPDRAEFQRDLGVLQLFVGDIATARTNLHRALELDPHVRDILPTLVRMTRMDSGGADAERLFDLTRALVDRVDELPRDEQVRVYYALGKALEDRGDYDGAFDAFTKANAMHRQTIVYDGAAFEARFQAIADAFNPTLFERLGREGEGAQSNRPIFIVGMPRSGTTLVEQIISAHPDVNGAGEIDLLHRLVSDSNGPGGSKFPDWVSGMNSLDLSTIGQAFLDALPPVLPGQSRQTVKRLVRSASFAQVREPIYTTSLDRWRPFERRLQPMLDAMGEPWASGNVEWDGLRPRNLANPARAAGT